MGQKVTITDFESDISDVLHLRAACDLLKKLGSCFSLSQARKAGAMQAFTKPKSLEDIPTSESSSSDEWEPEG